MESEPALAQGGTDIFKELEAYPWDEDKDFKLYRRKQELIAFYLQGGLSAILGSTTSLSQIQELTLRAQCFYLSRKKSIPIDFDAYKAYLANKRSSSSPTSTTLQTQDPSSSSKQPPQLHHEADLPAQNLAPYPRSFSEIAAMITAGKEIPGIKQIPPTVLKDQATKPVAAKRRKPWEKEGDPQRFVGGTFGDRRDEVIGQDMET
ncbi:hypothetical protein B7494_g838 [Chlorociboria aeruginascens]|nr:hypothetical protein B7494_g838 [Chlorociboria aeruginascens]